jgi:HEPN domain-containing protein
MNPPNTGILQKVKQWMSYGDEDLRLARHALTLSSGCPYRLIAYHGQQCTEKYLKAFLVFHRIDFPYTHNISRLLELCIERSKWPEKIFEAEELTPFAITARYPGEDEKVTKKEALRAVNIASEVRQLVRKTLKKQGSPF